MQTQWWELVQPPGCWAWELFLKGQNKLEGAWVPDAVEVPCQLWSASVSSAAGERSSRLQSQCSQSTLDLVMAFTCCPSQSFFSYAYVYHRTPLIAQEIQEYLGVWCFQPSGEGKIWSKVLFHWERITDEPDQGWRRWCQKEDGTMVRYPVAGIGSLLSAYMNKVLLAHSYASLFPCYL